jgi:hypothetical protein
MRTVATSVMIMKTTTIQRKPVVAEIGGGLFLRRAIRACTRVPRAATSDSCRLTGILDTAAMLPLSILATSKIPATSDWGVEIAEAVLTRARYHHHG